MLAALSPGIVEAIPTLGPQLRDIAKVVRRLDRDICFAGLRIEGRKCSTPGSYSGLAYPEVRTRNQGVIYHHPDGRIKLTIGADCDEEDIICLFAHELRHIGQFHRGREKYNVMTIHPLDGAESESDAYAFERRVLEKM